MGNTRCVRRRSSLRHPRRGVGTVGWWKRLCGERVTPQARAAVVESQIEAFALSQSKTGVAMAQFIALRAATCVGADYANFALLDRRDGRTIRLFHSLSLHPSIAHRYTEFDVDAPFPIAAAVRSGEVVVLAGAADYAARFPGMWTDTVNAGITATVSLPLIRADGSPIGALGFAWTAAPPFDAQLERALEALGELCTEIVERSEVYEAEHQMIADLHLRLLGVLPQLNGLASAARYLPADYSESVGGDWYEGSVLDDGRLVLVVGDVCGHGLAAAADMALVRGMITALLIDGVSVADVFARVSKVLVRRVEDILATAALVVVDSSRGEVTYATAGHPPPLLVNPTGSVMLLDAANAPMLGISTTRHVAATVPFPPGARLVMYTDGLVERRDRSFDTGIAELVNVMSSPHGLDDPGKMIDVLIQALIGEDHHPDDIAVLVIDNNTFTP